MRGHYKSWIGVLLITTAFFSAEIMAMSILKGEEVCIFSGFEGRLTYKGEPAAGARVVRHVSWKDEKGVSDETMTDEKGEFSFASRWDSLKGLMKILPSEFVAHQTIHVFYQDSKHHIWSASKRRKEEYSEFNGSPAFLSCELTDELEPFEVERGLVATSCRVFRQGEDD